MSKFGENHNYVCYYWVTDSECRAYDNRVSLFTSSELYSRTNHILGYTIPEYYLIKTRCKSLMDSSFLCPWHRHMLCEAYIPDRYCMNNHCHSTKELIQMGVQTALFIGNVPIRKRLRTEIFSIS